MTSAADPGFQPFQLTGSSNFSDEAQYTHQMIQCFAPTILKALESVSPSLEQPFVIGDYGTADGGASYNIVRQCIALLRTRCGPELPIHVIYEDQPLNDFINVFKRANGLLPGLEGLSPEFGNVFVTASGTSFYRQCLPDNSLDFILSCTALHWLSRCPVELPENLFSNLASPSLRDRFKEQARLDLKSFIRHREKELKPGGRIVLVNVGRNASIRAHILTVTDVWRSLMSDGTITEAEFFNTNFPMYLRSVEEWKELFEGHEGSKTGLTLVSSQSGEVPFASAICSEPDCLETVGRAAVRSVRSWTKCSLYNALGDEKSHAQKMDILDTFYNALFLAFTEKPEILRCTLPVFCMVLEKTTDTKHGHF